MMTKQIYLNQISSVMAHVRGSIVRCENPAHDELWWIGKWPDDPRGVAADMAEDGYSDWWEELARALDNYRADLRDHGMDQDSLDELLGEVGIDAFVGLHDDFDPYWGRG